LLMHPVHPDHPSQVRARILEGVAETERLQSTAEDNQSRLMRELEEFNQKLRRIRRALPMPEGEER
jgi:hypothetical protein